MKTLQPEPQRGDIWEFHTAVQGYMLGARTHRLTMDADHVYYNMLRTHARLVERDGKPWCPVNQDSDQPEPQADDVWEFHTEYRASNLCTFSVARRLSIMDGGIFLDDEFDRAALRTHARLIERAGKPWNQPPTERLEPVTAEQLRPGDELVCVEGYSESGYGKFEFRAGERRTLAADYPTVADMKRDVDDLEPFVRCDPGPCPDVAGLHHWRRVVKDSQPASPMIAQAELRGPEEPAANRNPSGPLRPPQHDFSDPYCVTGVGVDKRPVCKLCGLKGDAGVDKCTPNPDWRGATERHVATVMESGLFRGWNRLASRTTPLPTSPGRIGTPTGRDGMVGGFWRRAGDGRTRRV